MIVHRVEQGTLEWLLLRLGIPTASRFADIVTPAKLQASKTQTKYMAELVAEWALNRPLDDKSSVYMERGSEFEERAIAKYELLRDVQVDRVGFLTTDDGLIGCSPDALVGEEGGFELKIPSAKVHMEYLLYGLPADYDLQVQGGIWIAKRKWWDFMSWHPTLPQVLVRVAPAPHIIEALEREVPAFERRLAREKDRILETGYVRPPALSMVGESGQPKFSTTFAGQLD